jgi:DNA-binding Xre family transcriptional regulator
MITSNLFSVWKSREQRLGRRLTYAEVSQATGVSQTTLTRWMTGNARRFGSDTLGALMAYFECGLEDLLVEVTVDRDEEGGNEN